MLDATVGAPFPGPVLGSDIAEQGHQGGGAGATAGLDVALRVADVEAGGRVAGGQLAGMQDWARVRLGVSRGIAAHDAGWAVVKAQGGNQRLGQPDGLVGYQAPAQPLLLQAIE